MKTTLQINSVTLEINDRSEILTKREIQSAIKEARTTGEFVYCSCQSDRPHRMVPYLGRVSEIRCSIFEPDEDASEGDHGGEGGVKFFITSGDAAEGF